MIKDKKLKQWFAGQKNNKRCSLVKILDVEYAHLRLTDNSDLYIT